MTNNFLTGLKEKKDFMKVSMTTLVGVVSLYAGAILYSANAMKPEDFTISSEMQTEQSETAVDVDQEEEMLSWTRPDAVELYKAAESGDVDEVRELLEETSFRNICSTLHLTEIFGKKQSSVLLTNVYDLYDAARSENFDQVSELLKDTDNQTINLVLRLAIREQQDIVVDVINRVRVGEFCDAYGGRFDVAEGTINCNGCKLNAEALDILVDVLKYDKMFWSLRLSRCDLDDYGVQKISELLKTNTTLCVLDLDGMPLPFRKGVIGAKGAGHLSEALKVNSSITELNLAFNNIGAEGADYLSEALKVNSTITKLSLGQNDIGAEGANHISEALKVNTSLVQLSLIQNNIGSEGATDLSKALKVNSSLTQLNLVGNNVGPEGAKKISESLEYNQALKDLALRGNDIGYEGIIQMAELMKKNTTLTSLDLRNNNPGDKGDIAVADAMEGNITLTDVDASVSPLG